ncbi:MAG: pro-apoptotic serine protease [Pseudomonadota bacterium]|nr:pro-apoptotic serine protease [Pseudomonadota bacterium]
MIKFVFALLCLFFAANVKAEETVWSKTLERVANSVVTIRVDAARAFDTAGSSSTQATGFVVDAERGLILTNRHVVQSGPVIAEALFLDREEVELKPVYRDPVHDFGFFQYDPAALKFIKPQSLRLKPEKAKVGREIRVIGNDAGEQLSILAGTLARLDREAPDYGRGRYNDFNTFYYQSASGVSGGSSGSPVIDIDGDVLALNAGGNRTAQSSFFLPLQRVVRALKLVQASKPILRGTLQTTLSYQPYDEARRLGLRPETEKQLRKINPGVGVLVVDLVQPQGPAHNLLQPGDIVLKAGAEKNNLHWLHGYDVFEAWLDDQVDKDIYLQVERNGMPQQIILHVSDLHAITPDRYISFGEAVVHNLSYQQARHLNQPIAGVYVAQPGYVLSAAGVPAGAVIVEVDNHPVRNLDELEKTLDQLSDGEQTRIRFITFGETKRLRVAVFYMDRRWFAAQHCQRNDASGLWSCRELNKGPLPAAPEKSEISFARYNDRRADRLSASMVNVRFDIPYHVDGVQQLNYSGAGLVIDDVDGLVLVDRNTVPIAMGDVRIVLAGSVEIPGRVLFVHPLHNIAIVQYDSQLISGDKPKAAVLKEQNLQAGDDVWLVGLKNDYSLLAEKMTVAAQDPLMFDIPQVPSFRETNLDVISLNNAPFTQGGVLTDDDGNVLAQWSSFAYGEGKDFRQYEWGVPIDLVKELLDQWHCCKLFKLYSLEAELSALSITQARKLGLNDEWMKKFQNKNDKRQVIAVSRRVAGSDAEQKLQEGDLIIAVDGKTVHSFREVELACQKPQVKLTIMRAAHELVLDVATAELGGRGTDHIVQWAGALIQNPHREISAQRGTATQGVYVSFSWFGSPANRYNLQAVTRIIRMNDEPVRDLTDFIQRVKALRDSEYVRLNVRDLFDRESVITLKQNNHYWPAREVYLDGREWRSRNL